MRQFKKRRTFEEFQAEVNRRQWELDTQRFDGGSDHVTVHWTHDVDFGTAVISMASGKILAEHGMTNQFITSDAEESDELEWFHALLNTVFVPDAGDPKKDI